MPATCSLTRRTFLTSATAATLSSSFLPLNLVQPAKAEELQGHVHVDALAYPGYFTSDNLRSEAQEASFPHVVAFGVGATGTEAFRQLPSIWKDDIGWSYTRPPPESVHQLIAEAIETSRLPFQSCHTGERRVPLVPFYRWPMHLAVIGCVLDDARAFARAARLAAFLTSRSVPAVLVGKFGLARPVSERRLAMPEDVDLASLPTFRLLRILDPKSSPRVDGTGTPCDDGRAIALAANTLVKAFWDRWKFSALDFLDFIDGLFYTQCIRSSPYLRHRGIMDTAPVVARRHPASRIDLPFQSDRWGMLSFSASGARNIGALRRVLSRSLKQLQSPEHRWSPIFIRFESNVATTGSNDGGIAWKTSMGWGQPAGSPVHCVTTSHICAEVSDELNVSFIGVQLPTSWDNEGPPYCWTI